MGRKKTTGLFKKRGIWQIDKQILGRRIRLTTGTANLSEAEIVLARRIEELRQIVLFGTRPKHDFTEGIARYLNEKKDKITLSEDRHCLTQLHSYLGHLSLEAIHMGTLQPFIQNRQKEGVKNRTINAALEVIRHLLNLAASEWIDEHGQTWLTYAPKIRLLPRKDSRRPYPLSWEEQERLFNELPDHIKQMALFKVNTGCREQEVCRLQWEWEIEILELQTSVFIIPSYSVENGHYRQNVKNAEDRLVVLNKTAQTVLEAARGNHPRYVFTYRGNPIKKINGTAWQRARKKVHCEQVRVHDLKHTFGRRLRAAGVGFEDRQDLLGHKSGRITTHYSSAEISHLIAAANTICLLQSSSQTLTLLRSSRKTPTISPRSRNRNLRIVM